MDSIRGCAAFVVVIHHCLLSNPQFCDFFFSNWRTEASTWFQRVMFFTPLRLFWAGSEAVILFYVLSGLVLSLPWIERRAPTWEDFMIKRVCRLYIPYAASIAVSALLAHALGRTSFIAGLSRWYNEMSWTNPVTTQALFDHAIMGGRTNYINGVVHTLVWEMRVSAVFPLMMVPIVRFRHLGFVIVVAALLAAMAGTRLVEFGATPRLWREHSVGIPYDIERTAYYAFFFLIGTAIALNLRAIRQWLTLSPAFVSWLLFCAGLFAVQQHWTQFHSLQDALVAGGAALLIISSLGPGRVETVFSAPPLRWLGRVSYSLYLTHVPLLLCGIILLRGVASPYLVAALVIPLSLPLAWMFYKTVERPSQLLGKVLTSPATRASGELPV